MSSYLDGKKVVITGASSGIGAQLARELARRGGSIGLVARRESRLLELRDELTSTGATAVSAVADVTDSQGLNRAFDALAEQLSGVDIVIANAGYAGPERPEKFKPGRAIKLYDANLFGALRTFDWALPRFLEQRRGHLVGIASVASFFGIPHHAAYSGSKAAMRIHLQSLRLSLRPVGIAVTTICPGFVRSEMTEKNRFPMPFLWPTERAARKIANAIEKRSGQVVFPWQMRIFTALVSALPVVVVEKILGRG